jgi:hypothetical protein
MWKIIAMLRKYRGPVPGRRRRGGKHRHHRTEHSPPRWIPGSERLPVDVIASLSRSRQPWRADGSPALIQAGLDKRLVAESPLINPRDSRLERSPGRGEQAAEQVHESLGRPIPSNAGGR